ncbi:MAG: threonylcarbamoyl-AMP synthase [Bacteroidia bacterium]|nr:threonylcarbamoyl-AMP synthase [Bacteroidia bacterium]
MVDIIEKAVDVINRGGILLYPTDTIWGLGCDPFNSKAIEKVLQLKKRDADKAFILLVDSIDMLKKYIDRLHPRVETLLFYNTRPLTIIYDNPVHLPEEIISSDGSIAIRVTTDPFCKHLIHHFGKPIISTSANVSGEPYPPNFSAISSEIISGVDYVVNIRQTEEKEVQPSVIATVNSKGELEFIRS